MAFWVEQKAVTFEHNVHVTALITPSVTTLSFIPLHLTIKKYKITNAYLVWLGSWMHKGGMNLWVLATFSKIKSYHHLKIASWKLHPDDSKQERDHSCFSFELWERKAFFSKVTEERNVCTSSWKIDVGRVEKNSL